MSEVNTSFMYNHPRPLVVLLPFCTVGCDSPVPITVMFNQEVSRLSALSFVTQGRIMSLVHIAQPQKGGFDRYIVYLRLMAELMEV